MAYTIRFLFGSQFKETQTPCACNVHAARSRSISVSVRLERICTAKARKFLGALVMGAGERVCAQAPKRARFTNLREILPRKSSSADERELSLSPRGSLHKNRVSNTDQLTHRISVEHCFFTFLKPINFCIILKNLSNHLSIPS